MKFCRLCLTEKPIASFHRCAQNADRLKHHCRDCQKNLMATWRRENADKVSAYAKSQRAKEKALAPEMLARRRARYYERNKDRLKPRRREYAAKHSSSAVERARKWAALNPERHRASQINSPSYSKQLLSRVGAGIPPLSYTLIPESLVEAKQISLRIKRFLKEK